MTGIWKARRSALHPRHGAEEAVFGDATAFGSHNHRPCLQSPVVLRALFYTREKREKVDAERGTKGLFDGEYRALFKPLCKKGRG